MCACACVLFYACRSPASLDSGRPFNGWSERGRSVCRSRDGDTLPRSSPPRPFASAQVPEEVLTAYHERSSPGVQQAVAHDIPRPP